ncbi:saccharopine dehydrogenase NADP-binding domain-containing protein [Bacillus mycoides]|uniref:saccharopine dehydrogenase NADP-binding domain-containing protein n=1 Tax=Bacillus mycoides TaxID=1405 RepID=UPI00339BC336
MNKKTVLIVGGYGVVGGQIARILHDRHPDLEIRLGGRTLGKALPFESERVKIVKVDNTTDDPLRNLDDNFTLVVNAVNDPQDRLLLSAVRKKIPLVDITRWTERFKSSIDRLKNVEVQSPVVLASGWMGGTAALFSKIYSKDLQEVTVDINALYSLQDKAGPNSTAYMDRLTIPFEVKAREGMRQAYPMTNPIKVRFPNGYITKCYRLDTPDHVTLPESIHAVSTNFRIAFDSKISTYGLVSLVNTGIWKMISGEKFTNLRKNILYKPGRGSAHNIVIHLKGYDATGVLHRRCVNISDPLGQTHLTALGAAVQAENILQTSDIVVPDSKIYFPENLLDLGMNASVILDFYREYGVNITKQNI